MNLLDQWYYINPADPQATGPLTEREIHLALKQNKISWATFVCNAAIEQEWKRFWEVEHFKETLQSTPSVDIYNEILMNYVKKTGQTSPKFLANFENWFFQLKGNYFGPVSINEAKFIVQQKLGSSKLYTWKRGLHGWQPIEKVTELKAIKEDSNRRKDKRHDFESPVIIQIDNEALDPVIGISKDLSVGGIFVVTPTTIEDSSIVTLTIQPDISFDIVKFSIKGVVVTDHLKNMNGIAIQFLQQLPEITKIIHKISDQKTKN